MDKVVKITQTYVGEKLRGLRGNDKKAELVLKVGIAEADMTGGDTGWYDPILVSDTLNLKASPNPAEAVWNALAREDSSKEVYLVVGENITQYRIQVTCPECPEVTFIYGTFNI